MKLLIWDVTCQDTFAPSYSAHATREAGAVAGLAEERKVDKYVHLRPVPRGWYCVLCDGSGLSGT